MVTIAAINDFHGALEPARTGPPGTQPRLQGGAAALAAQVAAIRARRKNVVAVSAGDLIGASQFVSALFLDEPTIGVMNRMGLDFNAVGNHEFDKGQDELLRMQRGGCRKYTPRQPCQVERFAGARFRFLAASTRRADGRALFPSSAVRTFGQGAARVRVGFIGLTLQATPTLVTPSGVAGLRFGDEAEAINAETARLRRRGTDAVVVLIHQGGRQADSADPQGCNGLIGEIVPILTKLNTGVDVVVSGHTHAAYVCDWTTGAGAPILLTSAGVNGALVTEITLTIDPALRRATSRSAVQHAVSPADGTDAEVAAYVARYKESASEQATRIAGSLATTASGLPLAQLVADAQLSATRGAGAQIALTNPFGVRAPLEPHGDGTLSHADLYRAQPFNNTLVTQSLTGAEINAALEQGFDAEGPEQGLAVSAGFAYAVDRSRPPGQRIVSMTLDGAPVLPGVTYRVTTNSFLASGGDGFTVLARQRDAAQGGNDLDALEAWLKATPPRLVPVDLRMTVLR